MNTVDDMIKHDIGIAHNILTRFFWVTASNSTIDAYVNKKYQSIDMMNTFDVDNFVTGYKYPVKLMISASLFWSPQYWVINIYPDNISYHHVIDREYKDIPKGTSLAGCISYIQENEPTASSITLYMATWL